MKNTERLRPGDIILVDRVFYKLNIPIEEAPPDGVNRVMVILYTVLNMMFLSSWDLHLCRNNPEYVVYYMKGWNEQGAKVPWGMIHIEH